MHYRELIVWQKAMDVAREVYLLAPLLPREEAYGMRSQLTRAAVSIAANIAEGWTQEAENRREHGQFLAVAHGWVAETETLLTLCEELGWFGSDRTVRLCGLLDEVSRMLTTLRRNSRAAAHKGS